MTKKLSTILATEFAIAFVCAAITLLVAWNCFDNIRLVAAGLVCIRIVVGLTNIVAKNVRLLAEQSRTTQTGEA